MRNCTYKITCNLCEAKGIKALYVGETHRAWGDRQAEHQRAAEKGDKSYGIAKHQAEEHPGAPPSFTYKLDRGHKTTINRQIAEALLIQKEPRDVTMNSKSEWGFNFLPQQVSTAREATKGPETSPRPPEPSPEAPDGRPLPTKQNTQETSYFESQYQRRKKRARIEKDIDARKTQVEPLIKTGAKSKTRQKLPAHKQKDDARSENENSKDSCIHNMERLVMFQTPQRQWF